MRACLLAARLILLSNLLLVSTIFTPNFHLQWPRKGPVRSPPLRAGKETRYAFVVLSQVRRADVMMIFLEFSSYELLPCATMGSQIRNRCGD